MGSLSMSRSRDAAVVLEIERPDFIDIIMPSWGASG